MEDTKTPIKCNDIDRYIHVTYLVIMYILSYIYIVYIHTYIHTCRYEMIDRQTDGWMGGQTDGRTN